MSRPIRLLLPTACVVLSFGLNACVGTLYDRMYSNKKTYFKPPEEKKEASAEDILKNVEGAQPTAADAALPPDAGLAVPPAPGDIPGLPPAMPDPAAPAAPPAAPAVPPPPL
jgi:hypothetical protein